MSPKVWRDKRDARPVVMVDDDPELLATYADLLRLGGFGEVVDCGDGEAALAVVAKRGAAAVVLDLGLQGMGGQEVLAHLAERHPEVPVVVVTGNSQVETAIACMRQGAFDYLVKPVPRDRLHSVIRKAIEMSDLRNEADRLRRSLLSETLQHPEAFADLVTGDRGMLAVMRYVEAVAPSINPLLVTGETGTGKELVARSCHVLSGLGGEFIAVNVAGLDEQLFADTLFGHRRGAFTGANTSRDGLLAKAEGGTLVLDEVGDLQPGSQVKLLRVLQEREYLPLGADQALPVRARIVATTNHSLASLRDPDRFRQDLFYRLAVHHVHVPPLRERRDDVPLLWAHFLARQATVQGRPIPDVSPDLVDLLMAYAFPGNVRELESLATEAFNTAVDGRIEVTALRHRLATDAPAAALPSSPPSSAGPGGETPLSAVDAEAPIHFGESRPIAAYARAT